MTIEARFRIDRGDFRLDVKLSLPGSGVTAIFGPSGCGKTTLLRAIAGLEHTATGYLKVGEDVWQDSQRFLPPHRRPLGYVFQEPSLFAHLNVRGNLEYGRKRLKHQTLTVSLDRAVELLGIGQLLERRPHQLSGGEQQRVAIARALAVSPSLLLLDEPLASLDEARKQEILPYLEALHCELDIPLLYVSHSRQEVARLADHLLLLTAGRVQASGSVAELFSRLDLPLAQGEDSETVIEAVVSGRDETYHISHLDFPGGRFAVAGKIRPLGQPVRLQIMASDVSLTLEPQRKTSILNIFPAVIEQIAEAGTAQVMVQLSIGSVRLLSRITRKSAVNLELKQGMLVHAQVKSVAVLT
ncbi:MAG: molybdenum ABC transporter ATP-binding protein [Methylococcales bacterium]|nr:molybdenum ABC transporter ATP-binding protein [Methylococcales bacterium]